ncbi:hypothetical protein M514_08397 [Trichuris suis]|uniref:Reverse transcriptase/retrotransposon-derived protein RNase H-like domain-containing protein n=1 Tax=Trichuris suis TaxID=68888 RepID=A0A085M0J5_9BILA|nr:hypothetical protein M513_08397 [Trichuris suis]KFD63149.1 hypothetical protein M514_08397 [Trichuris suis]
MFSNERVSVDPLQTADVAKWRQPAVTDVRRLIRLASYYRYYIKDFAAIAKPPHQLTEDRAKLSWDAQCDEASNLLKKALVIPRMLAAPDFS